ncbi:MAG: hypothetical protein ACC656_06485, partial [Candidatus Heimdallarchaeota archaeon]
LNRIHNSSIAGFFLGLLIYLSYFSNPGMITLSLGLSNQNSISIFIILITGVSFLGYKYYPKFKDNPRLFYSTPIVLLISIALVPWFDFLSLFALLGLFSLVIILNYNISKMPKHLSRQTSSLYFISSLIFLVFLFLIISQDGTIIPIIFTAGSGLFTVISYYYSKEWEVKK